MKKRVFKRLYSLAVAGMMFVCYPLAASAAQYDVAVIPVYVVTSLVNGQLIYTVNGNVVDDIESGIEITGTNHGIGIVVITSNEGANALIRFRDLNLDNSNVMGNSGEAVITRGSGNVTIELDGDNTLKGGFQFAGLQKDNTGLLVIKDDNKDGSLNAQGGNYAAGIGGGNNQSVDKIVIEGGTITATGGKSGAGIGGGYGGSGTVTINGGTVEATGGKSGAGIGGGLNGSGTVTISGGDVTATGGDSGAGIGGGLESNGSTITVSGSANVSARGGNENSGWGPGAAIGEGGTFDDNNYDPVPGADVAPDTSGLYTTGSITTYDVGTPLDAIKQGTASGNTIVGTVPAPDTNTDTTTPEEPKVNEPKAEEPKIEEPPVYTERSCIADVDVAALVGALLSSNASATTLDIEFDDNICLSPEIMTALFADNRVAKNCFFRHKGKRYALHIGAVNKQSSLYAEDFEKLAEEPDGLAGFMMMAKIFANLGVTMTEVQ